MRHLYNTQASVLRLNKVFTNGTPMMIWSKVATVVDPILGIPGELLCRLDLNFVRVGKDQPMPVVAGRAPDRAGVMFFDATDKILTGDRIQPTAGPISGMFELRVMPDVAAGFSNAHHMEVQVIEVAKAGTP